SILMTSLCALVIALGLLVRSGGSGPGSPADGGGGGVRGPTGRSIRGIGFVEPVTEGRRLAFQVGGVIARCPAEVGRHYRRGDVLMELGNAERRAAIAVADEDLKLAEAQRDEALGGVDGHRIEAAAAESDLLREQLRYWRREHERARRLIARDG